MQAEPTLRALRDRPFELLLALETRARDIAAGAREGAAAQEWIGVAFRMGGETFLVERDEAREVMGVPAPVTRVPGARPWILGLANVRGQLLPIIDMKQYLGSGELTVGRNTRVIVVPGAAPVARGPYRWLRHPNYWIVALELLVLPLTFGALVTAALFPLLHLALVWRVRIPVEEAALQAAARARQKA